jgi:Lon protease-like protein
MASLLCAGIIVQAQFVPPGKAPDNLQLPSEIPIFPLEATLLFPEVVRPLYIFEGRYRAMVADALKGDRVIGMTTLKPGFEADYRGRPPIYEIGCAGVITDYEELSGGRYNIELRGFVKFRVTSEDHSRAYRLARVDPIPEAMSDAEKAALHTEREKLEALITKGGDSTVPPDTTDEQLVNMVAQYLPMPHAERQSMLELKNVLLRARALNFMIESKVTRPRTVQDWLLPSRVLLKPL